MYRNYRYKFALISSFQGPAAFKGYSSLGIKGAGPPKLPADHVWVDDQTQALPRSVRQYLNGWVRAEQLAMDRWEAEVVVFEVM